jgi:diphosphomevalonate decarboxylase
MSSTTFSGKNLILESKDIRPGSVKWKSPSNIAIVKYWGKYGNQLPRNPSISGTLSQAHTLTELRWDARKGGPHSGSIDLEFEFEGKPAPEFKSRISTFLEKLAPQFPFLKQLSIQIQSSNSFPHSSGIASSASSMSALALCLCSLEDRLFGTLSDDSLFDQKASFIARLGSGSASRSIHGYWSMWGANGDWPAAQDTYAVPLESHVHPVFKSMKDAILIVSGNKKSVSSSAGHKLMDENPFSTVRYHQAQNKISQLLPILSRGDWESFAELTEDEALTLHGLMMCSSPPFILIEPQTIEVIRLIQSWRKNDGLPVCFTLDAGPNVHVLYPAEQASEVEDRLKSECAPLCQNEKIIFDELGAGPVEL